MLKKVPITLQATVTVYLNEPQIRDYKKFKKEIEKIEETVNDDLDSIRRIKSYGEPSLNITIDSTKKDFQEYIVKAETICDGYNGHDHKDNYSFDILAVNDEMAVIQAKHILNRGYISSLEIYNKSNNGTIYKK